MPRRVIVVITDWLIDRLADQPLGPGTALRQRPGRHNDDRRNIGGNSQPTPGRSDHQKPGRLVGGFARRAQL